VVSGWHYARQGIRRSIPVLALVLPLVVMAVAVALWGDELAQRVVILMFINISMVIGLQTFMGNSGVASFGHVGFMLLGAYGTILFSLSSAEKTLVLPDMPRSWFIYSVHLPFELSLLSAGICVALMAALVGIPLLRIGATAFGLTSFAFLVVVRVVAVSSSALTSGTRTLVGIPEYTSLAEVTIWALAFIAAAYAFKESRWGLKLRASREDPRAARSLGIDTVRLRWSAWSISAFITAVAGGLWAHYVTIFSPVDFWVGTAFLIISMLVVGGQGSVAGAVVGAVVITVLSQGLANGENAVNLARGTNGVVAQWIPRDLVGVPEFAVAAGLIVCLIFRPSGIMGGREISLRSLRRWAPRRGGDVAPPIRNEPTSGAGSGAVRKGTEVAEGEQG